MGNWLPEYCCACAGPPSCAALLAADLSIVIALVMSGCVAPVDNRSRSLKTCLYTCLSQAFC